MVRSEVRLREGALVLSKAPFSFLPTHILVYCRQIFYHLFLPKHNIIFRLLNKTLLQAGMQASIEYICLYAYSYFQGLSTTSTQQIKAISLNNVSAKKQLSTHFYKICHWQKKYQGHWCFWHHHTIVYAHIHPIQLWGGNTIGWQFCQSWSQFRVHCIIDLWQCWLLHVFYFPKSIPCIQTWYLWAFTYYIWCTCTSYTSINRCGRVEMAKNSHTKQNVATWLSSLALCSPSILDLHRN